MKFSKRLSAIAYSKLQISHTDRIHEILRKLDDVAKWKVIKLGMKLDGRFLKIVWVFIMNLALILKLNKNRLILILSYIIKDIKLVFIRSYFSSVISLGVMANWNLKVKGFWI